jgi:DNA-binding MarR family transcriptional regulator
MNMPFMNNNSNREANINPNDSYRITQMGTDKLGQGFNGDKRMRVLLALETEGSLTVRELAPRAHMTGAEAERIIKILKHNGFIAPTSSTQTLE